jgi:hypothetical protein
MIYGCRQFAAWPSRSNHKSPWSGNISRLAPLRSEVSYKGSRPAFFRQQHSASPIEFRETTIAIAYALSNVFLG